MRMVDLGGAVEIERALLVARQELARGAGSTTDTKDQDAVERARRRLRELGKLLLDPIAGVAGDAKHWIVGPDSALWLVPWGALVTSEGRYALEDRNITYVVSGRDLLSRASTEDKRTTAAIVFGAVDFDAFSEGRCSNSSREGHSEADPFRPLRGTDQEVRLAVAALDRLTKKTPIVLTKEAARESRLKQVERPEYLVLEPTASSGPATPLSAIRYSTAGSQPRVQICVTATLNDFARKPDGLRLRIWRMMGSSPAEKYWVST